MPEDENPEWTAPCARFMSYMFQLDDLIELTRRGTGMVTFTPRMVDALMTSGQVTEGEKATYEEKLGEAERSAKLAKSEIENEFPLLHSHALMGAWGALEGMIEDLAISWVQHDPSVLDHPKIAKIKVPLSEFRTMTEIDHLRFIVTELQRDLGLDLKEGATKFESLLTAVGLGGAVDKKVRDVIFEAQNLRNIFAHRAGVADRKFVSNCPHLGYTIGDIVKIGQQDFSRIFFGLLTYDAIVWNRCRSLEGMHPFGEDFPGFEGIISGSLVKPEKGNEPEP